MTSVCSGSLVYAAAGLLAGRPATTCWGAIDELRALGFSVEKRADDCFVDDSDVITSAGVSAGASAGVSVSVSVSVGIDMALHVVVRLAGVERARQVLRGHQYDPAPPG